MTAAGVERTGAEASETFAAVASAAGATSASEWAQLSRVLHDDGNAAALYSELDALGTRLKVLTRDELKSPKLHEFTRDHPVMQDIVAQGPLKKNVPDFQDQIEPATRELRAYNSKIAELVALLQAHISKRNAQPRSADSAQAGLKVASLQSKKAALQAKLSELEEGLVNRTAQQAKPPPAPRGDDQDGACQRQNDAAGLDELFQDTAAPYNQILEKLQALSLELKFETPENETILGDAHRNTHEIVQSLVAMCHSSLDTIFADVCASSRDHELPTTQDPQEVEEEKQAISSEIQSLLDEVEPVAHMAAEGQFLKPIVSRIGTSRDTFLSHNVTIAAYTSSMLLYMNKHLKVLAERFRLVVLHHRALFTATHRTYVRNIGAITDRLPTAEAENEPPASQEQTRPDATLVKMIDRYLRETGAAQLNLEAATGGRGGGGANSQSAVAQMQEILQGRRGKSAALWAQLQEHFEAAAKANLRDGEVGGGLLHQQIVADSSASGTAAGPGSRLRDSETDKAVGMMADEVEYLRAQVESLGLAGAPREADEHVAWLLAKSTERRAAAGREGHACVHSGHMVACSSCDSCLHFQAFVDRWKH